MAALLAYRLSRQRPISFSMAMNDYGFELMSDRDFPLDAEQLRDLFRPDDLLPDIQASINAAELARRRFRDIAVIAGLVFQGYPGSLKQHRQLQSSSALLFNVFSEYDPDNLLLAQAYQEVFDQQLEEPRLRLALQRIVGSRIVLSCPSRLTPFSFPIKVDSLRQHMSSEKLTARILTLQRQSR
jgi:ATP-dependent Lhr-like helicase